MPNSGDVVDLDLGVPHGREARFHHPAVVVTAQRILDSAATVVHVVPLTTTIRNFHSEIPIEPERANGLSESSAAQCQHVRSVSIDRVIEVRGNVGHVTLAQVREMIALILDLP